MKLVAISETPFAKEWQNVEWVTCEEGGAWLQAEHYDKTRKIHSARLKDGREWDCINGFRAGEEPRGLKILVCTPVYGDTVKRGYAHSMAQAMAFFAQAKSDVDKYIDVQMVYSSNLIENRHILVSRAFQFEATHLLFWDADIKVPPDAIVRLVNHHQPIVAINYAKKEPEARPTAYIDSDTYVGPCFTQEHHKGLQQVSSCGFGFMLIEMGVLEKLDMPLFQFTQCGQDNAKTETEDVFFCRKATEAGFPVLIDHDLSKQCAHIGDWEYLCSHSDIAQAAKQHLYHQMDKGGEEKTL